MSARAGLGNLISKMHSDPIRYLLFMNDRGILFCNDIGLYAFVYSLCFRRVINVTVIDVLASMYISP